jgi:hypothetical protein
MKIVGAFLGSCICAAVAMRLANWSLTMKLHGANVETLDWIDDQWLANMVGLAAFPFGLASMMLLTFIMVRLVEADCK